MIILYIVQLGRKKFILKVWSLMPVQSEGNNHASKINVFLVSYTIFFLLVGQKMYLEIYLEKLINPCRQILKTVWLGNYPSVSRRSDKFPTLIQSDKHF